MEWKLPHLLQPASTEPPLKPSLVEWKLDPDNGGTYEGYPLKPSLVEWKQIKNLKPKGKRYLP